MDDVWASAPLREVLRPVSRPEAVSAEKSYALLGAHWYARGLYTKDVKTGSAIQAKTLYQVEASDFVYNRLFAWKGSFAVASKENHGCYVSNEFLSYRVRQDRLDPHFLWYYFSRPAAWNEALGLSTGSTPTSRNRLKEEQFLAIEIPVPPLAEQHRIVARIEELAAKIEQARDLRRQAAEEAGALRDAAVRRVFNELGDTSPKALRDLVTLRGGGTPSKTNPLFWHGSIPWISPKDMKRREIRDAADHITEDALLQSSAKLLEPNCILVVTRGMILAHTVPVAVLRTRATINQDMKALVPHDGLMPEYLCEALWSFNRELVNLVERSTHDTRKLQTDKLLDFVIPVPSVDTQTKLLAQLQQLRVHTTSLQDLQTRVAGELDAMLPALLQRAFDGNLL